MSRIDFYSSAPARDRLISLVGSGHKARHVCHFTSDPWLDLSVIALAAWAVLVRAARCTGILLAQQVMGPESQDCDDLDERHLS